MAFCFCRVVGELHLPVVYQGALKASAAVDLPSPAGTIPVGTELIGIDLDCDQTGWGFTPVIGLDAKWGKLQYWCKV